MARLIDRGPSGTTRASSPGPVGPTMHRTRILLACTVALSLAAAPTRQAAATDSSVAETITAIFAREDPLVLDGVTVNGGWLRQLYDGRSGSELWQGKIDAVVGVLGAAAAEGLDAAAYNSTAIARRQADRSKEGIATLDLLVSDAVLKYARDVLYGRSRPRITAVRSNTVPYSCRRS